MTNILGISQTEILGLSEVRWPDTGDFGIIHLATDADRLEQAGVEIILIKKMGLKLKKCPV